MEYKEVWYGEQRGVRWEVIRWKLGDKFRWNYYLFIPIGQIPDESKKAMILKARRWQASEDCPVHVMFNYGGMPIIDDLDWHGGLTFYEKEFDSMRQLTGIKLGCDYAHLFDEDRSYTHGQIMEDCFRTIDKLWELVPNLKMRCQWNGEYYALGEMEQLPNGALVAVKNKHHYDRERR